MIRFCHFGRLRDLGGPGILMVQAMITCNDLTTLNYLNVHTDETQEVPSDVGLYMRHWTLRMLMLQLNEAMKLVQIIRNDQLFNDVFSDDALVRRLSEISPFLPGGAQRALFKSRITFARNKFAAHLDESAIRSALGRRASNSRLNIGKMEFSTTDWCTRYYAGEDIISTMLVRQAWGPSSEGDDLKTEADAIGDWFVQLAVATQNFLMAFLNSCYKTEILS